MKFIKEELINQGRKKRFMFAIGVEEAEIMASLLERAYKFMPTNERDYLQAARRIHDMYKTIMKGVPELREYQEEMDKLKEQMGSTPNKGER